MLHVARCTSCTRRSTVTRSNLAWCIALHEKGRLCCTALGFTQSSAFAIGLDPRRIYGVVCAKIDNFFLLWQKGRREGVVICCWFKTRSGTGWRILLSIG